MRSTVAGPASQAARTMWSSAWKASLDNTPVWSILILQTGVWGRGMNRTDYDAIVDTDRAELRDRIEDMRRRFYRLALSADPSAQCPDSAWDVQHIVAHVVSVAQRYRAVGETGDFRRARTLRELDQINQEETEALLAPIPVLVD